MLRANRTLAECALIDPVAELQNNFAATFVNNQWAERNRRIHGLTGTAVMAVPSANFPNWFLST
jgi:hypothetical protein